MDAKQVQNSSYLDILFEGRNKQYGSYELRRNYPKRAARSLGVLALAGLLAGGYYAYAALRPKPKAVEAPVVKEVTLAEPPPIDETKPPPPPPPSVPPPPVKPTVKFTPPVIEEDEKVREEDKPPMQEEMKEVAAGPKTEEGDPNGIDPGLVAESGTGTGNQVVEAPSKPAEIPTFVEQMPQFPGDINSYLANNLRYPDQAREAGVSGRVTVRFVVDEEGNISDVRVVKDLGYGTRQEAERVVRGMPKWKPGRQNGRPTKVWYTLPIKFELE